MAPTRASSQRPGLWKPLAPHALHAGSRLLYTLHPVGGAFYGKTYSFDALSLTARSSFDSFDASSARSMLFASSASNDCECTDTLAHNVVEAALMCSPERHTATHARWVQTSTYREVR